MHILCLAGGYGVGKSTLAGNMGNDTFVLPMADALRKELRQLGYDYEELYSKPTKSAIRIAMHSLGDLRRQVHGETYWAERWFLTAVKANKPFVICDDMRFMTDYEALQNYGKVTLAYIGPKDNSYDLHKLWLSAHCHFNIRPNALEVFNTWIKLTT